MTRLTLGNVVKVTAVLVFLPLIAYLVLVIGAVRKTLTAALEGLLYAGAFSVAVFVLDGAWGPRVLLALAAMGTSAVRAWHLRDLWLPARRRWWKRDAVPSAVVVARDHAQLGVAVAGPQSLPAAVARVRALADRNRHRLPGDAHGTVLQTCQVLESVIAAEQREPARDARFEYELDAVVRQYLPAVLTNYLAIAPSRVQERQADGRTPDEELAEQLRILAGQADALDASRHRLLTAELSTTGNFLRDKYAHQQLDTPELRLP